jgi:NitT/TauT family transport system substrate-binding protein
VSRLRARLVPFACALRGAASRLRVPVLLLLAAAGPAAAGATPALRIAVLQFGTVSWVMDVIAHHGLDKANGIRIDELSLASTPATLVALQAGRVDCVVTDWLWVSRQRAAGADWTFFPFSTDLGALIGARGAPIHRLADLRGRRLGVAGSPLDKSWLLLQALAQEQHFDLARDARVSFGAPPLLDQELLQGRLDAVLTFWNFAARLESSGLPAVLRMSDALRQLGFKAPIPLVGYVVSDRWARAHPRALAGFVRATRQAQSILATSDAEWNWLGPRIQARDPAELKALRDAFRAGIPAHWGRDERQEARALYALFAKIGGRTLVGASPTLQPGTFLDAVRY